MRLPASRTSPTALAASGVAWSPIHTQPSRSTMNCSYRAARGDRGTSLAYDAVARSLLILLSLIAPGAVGYGGDDDDSGGGGNGGSGSGTETTAEAPTKAKQGECRDVPQLNPKADGGQKKPRAKLDPAKTYTVEVK